MYPRTSALHSPDKAAVIEVGSGRVTTFAELDARSAALAGHLRARGLERGDALAVLMGNRAEYFDVAWAALRAGFYLVTVSRHATPDDVGYVLADSGARALVTEAALVTPEIAAATGACEVRVVLPDEDQPQVDGFEDYRFILHNASPIAEADECQGDHMPYSSGTTGRPKGIRRALPDAHPADGFAQFVQGQAVYGLDEHTVYLSPAPLYHTAPIQFCLRVQAASGTVVLMERFHAEAALAAIETHRVTHSQWVPTMFVRMLKLPESVRAQFDLSSHARAVHAAAPCPVEVKRQMINWWGPILEEYYAGSERNGATRISSDEWLRKPGSVGRPSACELRICDESGVELPTGESGIVYFVQPERTFEYFNDPDKTAGSAHPEHPNWTTLGDMGFVDEDGYLFLTDRQSFMIISGGVNIYPRMIEDALVLHPEVVDVAVIGVPNDEFGEEVKAIVEPVAGVTPDADLESRILGFAREQLAHYMVPKSVDFIARMPRLPTGKLPKRVLREPYWADQGGSARI